MLTSQEFQKIKKGDFVVGDPDPQLNYYRSCCIAESDCLPDFTVKVHQSVNGKNTSYYLNYHKDNDFFLNLNLEELRNLNR